MPFAPAVQNQRGGVVHSNDPVTIVDYPSYVSIQEWAGAQSTAFGVSPPLNYPPIGTGIAQTYGTGTTDDSLAINAALVALAGTGIALYLPGGSNIYLVTANAIVNAGGVAVLFGAGATFTGTYAATLTAMGTYVGGVVTVPITSTTQTLTAAQGMASKVILTGSLTANTTVVWPLNIGLDVVVDPTAVVLNAHTLGAVVNGNTWGTTLGATNLAFLTIGPTKFYGAALTP